MTLIQYEPWHFVGRLQRHFDRVLADAFSNEQAPESNLAWIPSVDVYEEPERFVVRADLPGVDPKDIEITAHEGVLTLRGTRSTQKSEKDGTARVERVAGRFLRRFTLPKNARSEGITASQNNGVLEVSIPKQAKPEPLRIKIEAA